VEEIVYDRLLNRLGSMIAVVGEQQLSMLPVTDNDLSGRGQAALALGTAYGLITGRQKFGNADDNFWKELEAARAQVTERTAEGGALRITHIPSKLAKVVTTAFLPFEVRKKVSDDT
jgi:hypothetical protein